MSGFLWTGSGLQRKAGETKMENKKRRKKPEFVVKESKHGGRIKRRWRFPDGRHSGVRQVHRGKPPMPTPGYGREKKLRHLHSSGRQRVVVSNEKDLLALDREKQAAVLSSTLGGRKRQRLLELAQEKKLLVLNFKDITGRLKAMGEKIELRRKARQEKMKSLSRKEEEKKKKAEEKARKEAEEKAKKDAEKNAGPGKEREERGAEAGEGKDIKEEEKEIAEKTIIKKQ